MPDRPQLVRCGAVLAVALLAGWFALRTGGHADFGQSWFAARAVLAGQNPYALIGPGRAFSWPASWFYPLPAALVAMPLAGLPEATAGVVFVTLSAVAFGWAVTRQGLSGLWAFASFAVLNTLALGQWSMLLAASVVVSPLAIILVAKPTIGAAMFVARPTRWAMIGGLLLVALAFVVQPGWLNEWRGALHGASLARRAGFPYVAPVTMPGGVLTLLALTRWRRMDARLLVAMACVPQSILPYEAVPLFLIPQNTKQMVTLVALSYIPFLLVDTWDYASIGERVDAFGRVITVALYLPATLMVLRRPNEGTVPVWLDRAIASWPAWLRGRGQAMPDALT